MIDDCVSWKYHISYICSQISRNIGIISKLRPYLSIKQLKQIYYNLIYPYIAYAILAWGSTYTSSLQKVHLNLNYFRNMFTLASQLHSYYTRNCNLYYIPPCRTNIRNFSIRFQGPKFFNSLSPEIQNSESIRLFGKRLKKFLLS